MTSDDELCDQETLEAMLDAEEEPTVISTKSASEIQGCVESVEEFLNAQSDDSDEEEDKTKKNLSNEIQDLDETEILASLIAEDSDLEEKLPFDSKSCLKQPFTKKNSPPTETSTNQLKGKISVTHNSPTTSEQNCKIKTQVTAKPNNRNATVKKYHCSTPKGQAPITVSGDNPLEHGQTDSQEIPPILSTQSIQEEMLKMQAKMLELQRMLEMQQSQAVSAAEEKNICKKFTAKKSKADSFQISQNTKQSKPGSFQISQNAKQSKAGSFQISQNAKQSKAGSFESSQNAKAYMETANKADTSLVKNIDAEKKAASQLKLLPDDDDASFLTVDHEASKKTSASVYESASLSIKPKRNRMEAELFGDSDSDWDGLDGEDKRNLSEAGNEIKRIMHSAERKREAHQAKFELSEAVGAKSTSWKTSTQDSDEEKSAMTRLEKKGKGDKNVLQCKNSSTSQSQTLKPAAENEKIYVDEFSKIRIVNPLISSSLMKMRMEGRKLIGVSRIHLKLKTPDLQGDWVTIAAVVGKTDAKSSSSGKPYCIWKLNDLEDLDNSVSFFLFGEVHKHLWKTEVGTVVGVLNPSIMESMEKGNSEPAFTIKNPNQLMIMGRSKDLGWCAARTKAGNKCIKFINKKFGDFCSYHVAAEYRKVSSHRLELQGNVGGVRPKSFEKKVFSKDCAYMYGGNTYVPNSSQKGKKNGITLKKLQQNLLHPGKQHKVNTLTISDIKPEGMTPCQKKPDDKDRAFMELISVPSPGSMNLVAYLKKNEGKAGKTSTPLPNKPIESITAKDLIKQHQLVMKQKLAEKKEKASQLLMASSQGLSSVSDPLKEVPKLGKGFYSGQQISLDINTRTMSLADRTKLKALAAIQSKGGLKKEDPNAVKKTDGIDMEKIRKRLSEDTEKNSLASSQNFSSQTGNSKPAEPPKKKPRLLGNVDLNSDEVKNILKAKSKHKGALAEAEAEREEVYFNELEKKEKMEEKLLSVTSIEITVVTCKQCMYTAQSALDSCKQENHTLVSSKTKKRFFVCKKCKHRTHVIGGKLPTEACSKCGTMSFEKTSMYKVREGPKLESEVLNIRGDEIKFINSMANKVYLNTVVDQ